MPQKNTILWQNSESWLQIALTRAMYDIVEQAKKERLLLYTLYKHVSILPIFYLPSGYW